MTSAALALALTLLAAPARLSRFEQGQKLFFQGDIETALKTLDAAALEGGDDLALERIHLLRAQCFAARQDFGHAEEAFTQALEANPEATLDPSKVDPTVVKLLDSVRKQLQGALVVRSTPAGATIRVDDKESGEAPQFFMVPIGRHHVEAKWPDGGEISTDVQVRPHRELRLEWVQGGGSTGRQLRPFGDIHGVMEVASNGAPLSGGLDLGGGIEVRWFRFGLWARLFPYFGLMPRAAFYVPLNELLQVYVQVDVPVWFRGNAVALGIGGAGGAEFLAQRWLGFYAEVGGQHLLVNDRNDDTHFTASMGARLRMP